MGVEDRERVDKEFIDRDKFHEPTTMKDLYDLLSIYSTELGTYLDNNICDLDISLIDQDMLYIQKLLPDERLYRTLVCFQSSFSGALTLMRFYKTHFDMIKRIEKEFNGLKMPYHVSELPRFFYYVCDKGSSDIVKRSGELFPRSRLEVFNLLNVKRDSRMEDDYIVSSAAFKNLIKGYFKDSLN